MFASERDTRGALPVTASSSSDFSGVVLFTATLRRWRIAALAPMLGLVAAGLLALLIPPTYTATTRLMPEGGPRTQGSSGLAGFASQFGVSVPTPSSASARLFADLLTSRTVLESTLAARVPTTARRRAGANDSMQVLQLLQVHGRSRQDSLASGVALLKRVIAVNVDVETNVLRLSVESREPETAAEIANRLVQALNDFNTKTRQSSARTKRQFVEGRVADADAELQHATNRIRDFLERNRQFESSPQLQFEYQQLQRQLAVAQEMYLTLRREYETARIEEVNDTPVLTVIDSAETPLHKTRPRLSIFLASGVVVGAGLGILTVGILEFLARLARVESGPYAELLAEWRRLVAG